MINANNASILLAAGGSGGHIFPALHIAEALKIKGYNNINFVGVGRPAEEVIFEKYNYTRFIVETGGLKQGGLTGLFRFIFSAPKAFIQTWRIFSTIKPSVVIATGGYSAFYPVLVAFLRRVPRIVHEAENKFGTANYFLSLLATWVTLAFESASAPFWARTKHTGHPVRRTLANISRSAPISANPKKILIMGGSQGSRALDNLGIELASFLKEQEFEIWQQCRKENEEKLIEAYKNHLLEFKVQQFIHDLDSAYNWCDIIISRAGAGSVSEIAVVNRPAIFVPYPFAQGDHQTYNASVLCNAGKAVMFKEGEGLVGQVKEELRKLQDLECYNAKLATLDGSSENAADKIADLAISTFSNTLE